ncbi:MAG: tetratricopeptide repeat protein [Desulfovibrionaceae bacterium]
MSKELIQARKKLGEVKLHLKHDKLIAAATAINQAVSAIIKTQLMKSEKEEFDNLLSEAVYQLGNNAALKKVFPLQINYAPGQERDLSATIQELLAALEEERQKEVRAMLAGKQQSREASIAEAQALIDRHEYGEAKKIFDRLIKEHHQDVELKADAGERFLKAGRYEEAYEYLAKALADKPDALHLYNRIGIALRKMGRFDVAEKYYFKAREYAPQDPNLYFNIGRLYIDWRKWDKVQKAARVALKYKPDFEEAQKMLAFATKKLAPQDN